MPKLEPSFAWLGQDGSDGGGDKRAGRAQGIKAEALAQRRDAVLAYVGLQAPPVSEEARATQQAWAAYQEREKTDPSAMPQVSSAALSQRSASATSSASAASAAPGPRPLSAQEMATGRYLAASEDAYQMEVGRR